MKEIGRYDSSLQMFVELPHGFNYPKLLFMRWLGVNGRLEHAVAGNPTGEAIPGMIARFGGDAIKKLHVPTTYAEKLRIHISEIGDM